MQTDKIYSSGPYLQRKNSKIKVGCQMDLLINEKNKIYTVCEFKSGKLDNSVVTEVAKKINAVRFPKNTSIRTLLITTEHKSLISNPIKDYFDHVLTLDDFLK